MEIRFWGTRGSIAAPGQETVRYGGNTTCVEVVLESGERIILDAGTGIRPLGRSLLQGSNCADCLLLITHIHWDHILGFPYFLPLYRPGTRVRVDGCTRAVQGLRMTLHSSMLDGLFPVKFEDLSASIEPLDCVTHDPLRIGEAEVEGIELQHPQGGMGFRIREGGRTLVFLTDNELRPDAWPGRAPKDYACFCEGAQLLIHDAQYLPEEMAEKRGWGHSDFRSVVDLASEAGVEQLVLHHHDPERSDPQVDGLLEAARRCVVQRAGGNLRVAAAREGDCWRI